MRLSLDRSFLALPPGITEGLGVRLAEVAAAVERRRQATGPRTLSGRAPRVTGGRAALMRRPVQRPSGRGLARGPGCLLAQQRVDLLDPVVGVLGVGVGADLVGPALRAGGAADHGLVGQALVSDGPYDLALLLHGGGEQGAHADDVSVLFLGPGDEARGGHVAAEVADLVAVGLEVGDHDRLADVVHVALHGADDDAPLGLGGRAFEGGVGDRGSSGHGVGAHHQLGQEELAALEELADLLDALDEALRHDLAGGDALVEGALRDHFGGGAVAVDDALGCFSVDVGHALDSSHVSQQLHRTARYGGCRKGGGGTPQAGYAAVARKPPAATPRRSPVLRRDAVYQSRAEQPQRRRPCERAARAAMLASWREIPRRRHPPPE